MSMRAEASRPAVKQAAIRHSALPTAPVVAISVGVASSHGESPVAIPLLMKHAAGSARRAMARARRHQVHLG